MAYDRAPESLHEYYASFRGDIPPGPDMSLYQFRLKSFINWPFSRSPSRLARAGFYYEGHEDIVKCYSCGGQLGDWGTRRSPVDEHRRAFPNCALNLHSTRSLAHGVVKNTIRSNGKRSHISKEIREDVLDGTKSDDTKRKENVIDSGDTFTLSLLGDTEVDSGISIQNCPYTDTTQLKNPFRKQSPVRNVPEATSITAQKKRATRTVNKNVTNFQATVPTQTRIQSKHQADGPDDCSTAFNNHCGLRTGEESDVTAQKSSFITTYGESSQKQLNHDSIFTRQSSADLAGSTPDYNGQNGRPPTANPNSFTNHDMKSRPTTISTKSATIHVPSRRTENLSSRIQRDGRPTASSRPENGSASTPSQLSNEPTDAMGSHHASNATVSTTGSKVTPVYGDYKTLTARLATFEKWSIQDPNQNACVMAECGFFYDGNNDCVTCFHCGGRLHNWLPGDEPWQEHARWFPKCEFVISVKGSQFVASVSQGETAIATGGQVASNDETASMSSNSIAKKSTKSKRHATSSSKNTTATASTGGNLYGSRHAEDAPVEAFMKEPPALAAISVGYTYDEVYHKAREKFTRTGLFYKNVDELIDDLFSDDNNDNTAQPNDSDNGTHHNDNDNGTHQNKSNTQTKPQSPERKVKKKSQKTHTENVKSEMQEMRARIEALMAENEAELTTNQQLKEDRICKVCWDKDFCIVFLPCGHMVTCQDCAAALRDCPICRNFIRGTIKTFFA